MARQIHTLTAVEHDRAVLEWLRKYRSVVWPPEGTVLNVTVRKDPVVNLTMEWEV